MLRMAEAGISFKDIDIVFITHFHVDHISDLFALLWALKYPRLKRAKKLMLIGPEGFLHFYDSYIKPVVFPKRFDSFEIEILEICKRMDFEGFSVSAISSVHTKESISYKFEESGKTLVIGGDMDYNENIIELAKGGGYACS